MTKKVYRTAMGKTVDLGALMLQNETIRAVGNMRVNARGDNLDSNNRSIEKRTQRVTKQYQKQTNMSPTPVTGRKSRTEKSIHSESKQTKKLNKAAKIRAQQNNVQVDDAPVVADAISGIVMSSVISETTPKSHAAEEALVLSNVNLRGGLAAAIAQSRQVKQELEKSSRDQARSAGIKKI